MSVSDARLGQIGARFAELEARLASGTLEGKDFIAASRDYAELEPVAKAAAEVREMRGELASLQALDDPEMRELADEEIARLKAALPEAEWKVTCIRFAPNAPEQNPVEDVWLKGKTYLRKLFALNKTFAQVKHCFSTFLQALQFTSTKLSWYWPTEQMI